MFRVHEVCLFQLAFLCLHCSGVVSKTVITPVAAQIFGPQQMPLSFASRLGAENVLHQGFVFLIVAWLVTG